jgi:hypothetical protein
MRKTRWLQGACALAVALGGTSAFAADHRDSVAAVASPAADINDVYAWVEAEKVVLAMTVFPVADANSKFDDALLYAFHVESSAGFGMAGTSKDIICTFTTDQAIDCKVGDPNEGDVDDSVAGDASKETGLASASGKINVFAGLRADPFYFNLDGFRDAVATVKTAAAGLTFDGAGCPGVDAATSGVLVGMLQGTMMGTMPAANFFGTLNTLAIVMELEKSLIAPGGSTVAVWASTHMKGG